MSKLRNAIGESYKVIRGYIPAEEAIALGKAFIEDVDEDSEQSPSNSVGEAYDQYNRTDQIAILGEKIAFLNELLGEKVLPAYTYSRVYKNNSPLLKHKDRESCEISLSIHLYGDKEWAFCIDNAEGEAVEIILEPGDAVVYDAPYTDHWRDEYKGESYAQVFHHYVYLNGEYSDLFFDFSGTDLNQYIKSYKNAVPKSVCDEIIKFANTPTRAAEWKPQEVVSGISGQRICDGFLVDNTYSIDKTIFDCVSEALHLYCSDFPHFQPTTDLGYTILRYSSGGRYKQHTDQSIDYNRAVAMIINLNDDYAGGELHFLGGRFRYKLDKGEIIMFPANYMYPHAITPIKLGTRYSIITWAV